MKKPPKLGQPALRGLVSLASAHEALGLSLLTYDMRAAIAWVRNIERWNEHATKKKGTGT